MLHPGEFVLGSTLERIRLPDDLVARLEGKSSARPPRPAHPLDRRLHRPGLGRARHARALERREPADHDLSRHEDRADLLHADDRARGRRRTARRRSARSTRARRARRRAATSRTSRPANDPRHRRHGLRRAARRACAARAGAAGARARARPAHAARARGVGRRARRGRRHRSRLAARRDARASTRSSTSSRSSRARAPTSTGSWSQGRAISSPPRRRPACGASCSRARSAWTSATKDAVPYFAAKWEMERAVKESGIEYVIFRPSFVFGKDGGVLPTFVRLARFAPVTPIVGPGTQRLQPIWVEDVARVLRACGRPRRPRRTAPSSSAARMRRPGTSSGTG